MTDTVRTTAPPRKLWDLELQRDYRAPSADPIAHAAEIVAVEAEFDEAWAALDREFRLIGHGGPIFENDDLNALGGVDREIASDPYDHINGSSTTPDGEVISVDRTIVRDLFARADLFIKTDRWYRLTGEAYDLPEFVTAKTAVIDEHNAPKILKILTNERTIHELGGHDVTPSITCDECTPLPGLAAITLGAMRPELAALLATTAVRAATLQREAEERRGTVAVLDLLAPTDDAPELIDGTVPTQGVHVIAGPSGSGKTQLATRLAVGLAANGRKAAYVNGEGQHAFGQRIQSEVIRRGADLREVARSLTIVHEMPDLFTGGQAYDDLLARGRRERPAIIVIDTLALASGDAVHDNAGHMSQVMRRARELADASGGAVILVGHTGKVAERGIRGSSAIGAAADCILNVNRTGDLVTVKVDKMRDGPAGQVFKYRSLPFGRSVALEAIASTPSEPAETTTEPTKEAPVLDVPTRILDVLAAADFALSTSQVVAAVNDDGQGEVALSTVRGHLSELVKIGDAQATGENRNRVYTWAG